MGVELAAALVLAAAAVLIPAACRTKEGRR